MPTSNPLATNPPTNGILTLARFAGGQFSAAASDHDSDLAWCFRTWGPPTKQACSLGQKPLDVSTACETFDMGTWDHDQIQADIRAVYSRDLPIPPWWQAEDRSAFIDYYAAQAGSVLIVELDSIADRVGDLRYCQADGYVLWDDEAAAIVAAEQEQLLDEARSCVMWDLTDAIAEQSALLTVEAVFAHPRSGREISAPAAAMAR
jgi:hypothetical protein